MAGSERLGPGCAARRAAAWAVFESEPESEPELRDLGAAGPAGSPPAAGPAVRPRRRRVPGEAAARRRDRERQKEQEALEKRRREAAAAWRLLWPERCLRLMEVCADPGSLGRDKKTCSPELNRLLRLDDVTCYLELASSFSSEISLWKYQCLKYVLQVSSKILAQMAWVKVLSSLDCKYSFETQAIPCSITWRRNMPNTLSIPDGPMVKSEEEKEVLVLVEPEDFLKRLFSLTQSFVNAPSASQPDLNQVLPLADLEGSSTKTYSLAVIGLDAYRRYVPGELPPPGGRQVAWSKLDTFVSSFQVRLGGGRCGCNQEHGRQQALSSGKQSPSSQPGPELCITQEEILEALVVLQLWGNIEVLLLDTWQEFGQHVSALTKAIAKRPYKRQLESQELPVCTAGAWASGVRVEKDGTGLWQVWKRQIQQFNRAYEECSTEDEKRLLLSDIPVKLDVSSKDRHVGPDLSCRIYLFMVSTDPDLVLDLST